MAQPDAHNSTAEAEEPEPVLTPGTTYTQVSQDYAQTTLSKSGWSAMLGMGLCFVGLNILIMGLVWLFTQGIGVFGNNIPNAWAFPIINFIWWIGIAHAGTFISTILMLVRQDWRSAINRFAEAMTLFAVTCAGIMPIIHLGRPWLFYWLFPYPNTMGLWPQWRSPLVWDVWAVLTYMLVSLLFWYLAVIPDMATMRDRAEHALVRKVYGLFALGWRGSSDHWQRFRQAYLLIGGVAVALVVSVHSIVGLDLAVGITPGWHTSVLPPYFLSEAFFSGFATVLMLTTVLRHFFGLHDYVTDEHLDNLAKIMLLTGLLLNYAFVCDYFTTWYGGNAYELAMLQRRFFGPYAVAFWLKIAFTVGALQLVWFKKVRRSPVALFIIGLLVNVGIWCEAYTLVVSSLSSTYLPSQWHTFSATTWDWLVLLGTVGLFVGLWLMFARYVPVSVIWELRELVEKQDRGELEYERRDGAPGEDQGDADG